MPIGSSENISFPASSSSRCANGGTKRVCVEDEEDDEDDDDDNDEGDEDVFTCALDFS
jgi:hypothetical protein